MRIGVLGGSFDPPHMGHLILAETAVDALDLEGILFVPVGEPPHKDLSAIAPAEHRFEMVRLAIQDNPRFQVSRLDMDRPGPHYTVDMLGLLQAHYPEAELYFLMGSDSLGELLRWRSPEGVIARAKLAVMRREGVPLDLTELAARLPAIVNRVAVVDAPQIGISATSLRKRFEMGRSIRYQVPDAVADYIQANRLYR